MKLKPEVQAAYDLLPENVRGAIDDLIEQIEGKYEYIEENTEDGEYDCDADYGLTDWDISIADSAGCLVSALTEAAS